jgi:hypothetical protein
MPAAAIPPPPGWNPQSVIAMRFPEIARLRQAAEHDIRQVEGRLDQAEANGGDTACSRQVLRELRWRLEYTSDAAAIHENIERLWVSCGTPPHVTPALASREDHHGYGTCTDVWFLKVDGSVDRMLAGDFDGCDGMPCFLDRINDADRLQGYLDSLVISRLEEDGIDRRKELNFATANLTRLILWQRPSGYRWDTQLETIIRRFIANWQDPTTGFFGADYLIGGRRFRTVDLSLTFHMARYLEGRIGYWPQLIDTLIGIRDLRYPNGWLDEVGMTNHNNYDVAILFQLGWPQMSAEQRQRCALELARLLDWCLTTAVSPEGEITSRATGESLPESYYFAIAFLDAVGFFDRTNRFWTGRDFPGASALQARLEERLSVLPQGDPMVRMAQERLRRAAAVE